MFNSASLSLPFEYNLVQSFTALSPAKAIDRIEKQAARLRLNGDKAEHQQQELIEAQAYIQSGELAFGEYHSSMIVFGWHHWLSGYHCRPARPDRTSSWKS